MKKTYHVTFDIVIDSEGNNALFLDRFNMALNTLDPNKIIDLITDYKIQSIPITDRQFSWHLVKDKFRCLSLHVFKVKG